MSTKNELGFDLNELNFESLGSPSEPPPILYKYLSDTQVVNVLEKGSVRFTPLKNTNDLFEVRAIFKKFAGPKLIQLITRIAHEQFSEDLYNKTLEKKLNEIQEQHNIKSLDLEHVLKEFERKTGTNLKDSVKNDVFDTIRTKMIPHFNSKDAANQFLDKIKKMLCFSLSERADIVPMWAYYANNHKGFVIAFDTKSTWFKKRADEKKPPLLKVNYFDGQIEELLDDIQKVIASKKTDWDHEREWRIHANEGQVDIVTGTPEEPIYLMNFPPEAVQRIILGEKTKPETENQIKEIVRKKYPHAEIYRLHSDPLENRMTEIKI